jgi:hypothetical protein
MKHVKFLNERVIQNNVKGTIVGPPGTGKSICTLAFVASLNRKEWRVVWIHLAELVNRCMLLEPNLSFKLGYSYQLPRRDNRRIFMVLDGYKTLESHKVFAASLVSQLQDEDRFVRCSSMATLGKTNDEDNKVNVLETFRVPSWTIEEYLLAIQDDTFYKSVKQKLDAEKVSLPELLEVHEEPIKDNVDSNVQSVIFKYYYAGGSCRFMFQYSTEEVIEKLKNAIDSVDNKQELIKFTSGKYHSNQINRLYGMTSSGNRFAVSSYTTHLFANESSEETIVELAMHLNSHDNPSIDGFLFEWLFFASVRKKMIKLFDVNNNEYPLPMSEVIKFDPTRKFKISRNRDGEAYKIAKDNFWLQPVNWNQGGYDAIYIDSNNRSVIFVQLTRSHKHDFKIRFFNEVLENLQIGKLKTITRSQSNKVEKWNIQIYFIVKQLQLVDFKISVVEDRDLLLLFDDKWTRPEENHVRICAIRGSGRLY